MSKVYVIGIGYRPVDKGTRELILSSDFILASSRLLDVFKRYDEFESVREKIKDINNVDETIAFIGTELSGQQPVVITLLASGDPMFCGIGRRAIMEFGRDRITIIPDLSSIQLAFSKIKMAWDDALLISLHGGPDPKKRRRLPYELNDIPLLLRRHDKIGILTDRENNPSAIARAILEAGAINPHYCKGIKIFVCERLGYPDEKITEGTPEDIAGISFSDPNVVIALNTENSLQPDPDIFGLSEKEILHSRGLITKDEIRAVALHKLRLPARGVLWDVGAGSGSISIEAAGLCPGLEIYAIEKDPEQIENIRKNKAAFCRANIKIIEGEAPDVLTALPSPDRVFIGGSSGALGKIIELVARTGAGIIVINAATIETLNKATEELDKAGFDVDVAQVSVSRTKNAGVGNYLSALNPIFIIKGKRDKQ